MFMFNSPTGATRAILVRLSASAAARPSDKASINTPEVKMMGTRNKLRLYSNSLSLSS